MTDTTKSLSGLTGLAGLQARNAPVVNHDEVADAMAEDKARAAEDAKSAQSAESVFDADLPRRAETKAKDFREMDKISQADRARAVAPALAKQAPPAQARFISRYPDLQIYVAVGDRKDVPIKFRHGAFNTSDPLLIEAIRSHNRCGTVLFREENDPNIVALREEAARRRDNLRAPSYAGPTTSHDGNEMAFNRQDSDLAAIEQQVVDFGA